MGQQYEGNILCFHGNSSYANTTMLRYVYVAYLVHFKFHCLRVLKVCKSCVVYTGLCELGGFISVFVSTSLFCNVLAMDRQQ